MRAVVCVPICPLHVRPQADAPLADEALCGWPLELLEQPCPGWFRVRTRYRYEGFAPAWALTVGEGGAARSGKSGSSGRRPPMCWTAPPSRDAS